MGDLDLNLNLNFTDIQELPRAKQPKAKSWTQRRALKKQGAPPGTGWFGSTRPNPAQRPYLNNGYGQYNHQQQDPPSAVAPPSQLKGYSFDEPPAAAAPVVPPPPRHQQQERFNHYPRTNNDNDNHSNYNRQPSRNYDHQAAATAAAAPPQPTLPVLGHEEEPDMPHPHDANRPANNPRNRQQQKNQQQQDKQKQPKNVGRLRQASKNLGYREPTPEQEDMQAASEGESEDIMAAITAAVHRDATFIEEHQEVAGAVVAKEKGSKSKKIKHEYELSDDEFGGRFNSSSDEEEDAGKQHANKNSKRQTKQPVAAAGGYYSSDGDDDDGNDADIVDFDPGAALYPALKKKEKQKKNRANPVPAPQPVRPGLLTHPGQVHQKQKPAGSDHDSSDDSDAAGAKHKKPNVATGDSFEALGVSQALTSHMSTLGFTTATNVQQQSIPPVLAGKDVLVKAPTGSGKTLCYLVPILHQMSQMQPRPTRAGGCLAVVITPTRELCLQVSDVLTLLARRFAWIVTGCIYGGENRNKEKARLRKGVMFLVSTPGRLLDHLQKTESFKSDALKWLVLDEADRLLDLGFEKKLAEIIDILEERKSNEDSHQTMLLSATLHSQLGQLAGLSLKDPVSVGFEYKRPKHGQAAIIQDAAGGGEEEQDDGGMAAAIEKALQGPLSDNGNTKNNNSSEAFDIPKQLKQKYMEIPCKLRLVALASYLKLRLRNPGNPTKLVVFFSNCDSVEFYHSMFTNLWEPATGEPLVPQPSALLKLHGNMLQAERTQNFLGFTKCKSGVLLCTDVAARGLDFPAVTGIVQFDPPGEASEYVHRVGRTARLGQSGEAMLFILPSERGYITHLAQFGVKLQQETATEILDRALGMDRKAGKGLPLEKHHGAYSLQKELAEGVAQDKQLVRLAADAFRSFVRAYATHSSDMKSIFHIKSLHLGHVAHSFALKERPNLVGKSSNKDKAMKRKAEEAEKGRKQLIRRKMHQGQQMHSKGGGGGYVLS